MSYRAAAEYMRVAKTADVRRFDPEMTIREFLYGFSYNPCATDYMKVAAHWAKSGRAHLFSDLHPPSLGPDRDQEEAHPTEHMRVADRRAEVERVPHFADLSLREALRLVAKLASQGHFDPSLGINAFLDAHATPTPSKSKRPARSTFSTGGEISAMGDLP